MKFKSVLMLAVAVGCGLVAMLGVQQALSGNGDADDNTTKVLVAITEIAPGFPLNETNAQFKEWPSDSIPEGAITSAEQYEDRAVKIRTLAGEMILMGKLGEKGERGASIEIPEGYRVISVSVNATQTHSGLMLPGDHVDVLVTLDTRIPGTGKVTRTKTVLEYIRVFATDNVRDTGVSDNSNLHAKNVSLLVTPDQMKLLKTAEGKGRLHLALRGKQEVAPPTSIADENIFDDVPEVVETQPQELEAPQQQNVQAFLDSLANLANAMKEEEVESEQPTWTMIIYAGDEVREETIAIPEKEIEAELERTQASTLSPLGSKVSGWGLLKKLVVGP